MICNFLRRLVHTFIFRLGFSFPAKSSDFLFLWRHPARVVWRLILPSRCDCIPRVCTLLSLQVFTFLLAYWQVCATERTLWKFFVRDDSLHFKAFKENALLPDEEKFLFPPYSAFKVESNRIERVEYRGQSLQMRIICLEILPDNRDVRLQNVPTAPRY